MSFPEYNNENYKTAGRAIPQALVLIGVLQTRLFQIQSVLKDLNEKNINILRSEIEEQQGLSEEIVPQLHAFKEGFLAKLEEEIYTFQVNKTNLESLIDLLIQDWEPEEND
jgi:hypothetical protein